MNLIYTSITQIIHPYETRYTLGNHPNTEDEKPNNSLSMIDIFVENGLQHISILTNKRDITATLEKRDPM